MKEMIVRLESPRHPVCGEDISVRYPYALSVALLLSHTSEAMNGKAIAWFAEFCEELELPEGLCTKLLSEAKSAEPPILHKILPLISARPVSVPLIRDLKRAVPAAGRKMTLLTRDYLEQFQKIIELSSAGPETIAKPAPPPTRVRKRSTTTVAPGRK